MYWGYTSKQRFCRWCGREYTAKKPVNRDGFHSARCKQAHYRAYKKYVTSRDQKKISTGSKRVTRKTHASQSATQGKKRKKRK